MCDVAYTAAGYETSIDNLAQVSLERDGVFGDDAAVHQMATMSGDNDSGWVARLVAPSDPAALHVEQRQSAAS